MDNQEYTKEYLPWRGVSKETMRHYGVLTKVDAEGKPVSIGYPWPDGSVKIRSIAEKKFEWSPPGDKSKIGLFGLDRFETGSHKYVTITEGELDALSLHQVLGGGPVLSVSSANNAHRDVVAVRDQLSGFERIYLAFDGDRPGADAVRAVAQIFPPSKVYVLKFVTRKDANEYLQHGEGQLLRDLWWNARPYIPENICSSVDEFVATLRTEQPQGFPYPFPTLTEMTYGIRTGEVVLLTAQEKVGKTSIMREILYKLLKESPHAVATFFLEETRVRLLQSLAGRELRQPVHLPDSVVEPDALERALRSVVSADDRLYVYSHFGHDDPDHLLENIRFLVTGCGVRHVLFDHFGMAVIGRSGKQDERQALEYLATKLEMMTKELDFSLIAVSHLNDYGQTRGSHYLTKVADITIQAIRNPLALDETERNTIFLQIPFNRFCAKSGPAGAVRLNPDTYVLEEVYDVQPANDNFPVALGKANREAA